MKKTKIIIPLVALTLTLGVCGYARSYSDVDPLEIINRLNGNSNIEVPKLPEQQNQTQSPVKNSPATVPTPVANTVVLPEKKVAVERADTSGYLAVNPLDIVKNPGFYIGKKVKFCVKFDKFTTLGLDYQPVMRRSENYITILIQRPDVRSHDIPLSELKIFMDRKAAEKHIDLNSGDEVEIAGKVFAKALGDAWMDVEKFSILKTVPKTNNN